MGVANLFKIINNKMAPPGESSGKNIDQNKEKTVQAKADEKFKRSIMKRRKFLKDLRRRSTIKRKLVVKEVRTSYHIIEASPFIYRQLLAIIGSIVTA